MRKMGLKGLMFSALLAGLVLVPALAFCAADLIVYSITKVSDMQYTIVYKNQGNTATGYFYSDKYWDGVKVGPSGWTGGLAAGATLTSTLIPPSATAGTHTIRVVVDKNNNVAESNESNNEKTVTVSVSQNYLPDLVVTSITKVSDTQYSYTVKNQGNANVSNSPGFYIKKYWDGVSEGSGWVAGLNAGASATYTYTRTGPITIGNHTIRIVADDGKVVTESNETNNEKSATFYISQSYAADLVVDSLTQISNTQYSVTLKNQGNSDAGIFYVGKYWDGVSMGSGYVSGLKKGATLSYTETKISTVGNHTLRVFVDDSNNIKESNESNNQKTITFIVR